VSAGDFRLELVPGDFPDEAVYHAAVGDFALWLKSKQNLEGPWDWVIEEDGHPIDLGGPFPTRELAAADLAAEAAAAGIELPGKRPDDVVTIPAAPDPAPAPPAAALDIGADPEVMGLALDLAIVALRRARARLPAARAA
jgi:hypothetical protein